MNYGAFKVCHLLFLFVPCPPCLAPNHTQAYPQQQLGHHKCILQLTLKMHFAVSKNNEFQIAIEK